MRTSPFARSLSTHFVRLAVIDDPPSTARCGRRDPAGDHRASTCSRTSRSTICRAPGCSLPPISMRPTTAGGAQFLGGRAVDPDGAGAARDLPLLPRLRTGSTGPKPLPPISWGPDRHHHVVQRLLDRSDEHPLAVAGPARPRHPAGGRALPRFRWWIDREYGGGWLSGSALGCSASPPACGWPIG